MKHFKNYFFIGLLASCFFSCQKEYSLEAELTSAGTWQFNDDTKLYKGNIDSAYIEVAGATRTLSLIGKSEDKQKNFLLHLYATDSFTVGTYKASLFQADFQYFSTSKNIYQADQFIGEFIVTITAIGNKNITGVFSGDSEDSTGTIKPLTLGKFTSRINLTGNGTGGGTGTTAVGTLGASADSCTSVSRSGTFTQGITLTPSNTVTIQATITTPGTYLISTNTVNGVSFSKSGIFTTAGPQTVILTGTGIPANSGIQIFKVTFGTSTCNFPITFGAGIPPPTGDYFPIAPGYFWAYGNADRDPLDSFLVTATSRTKNVGSIVYNVFSVDDIPPSGSPYELYYRKAAGDYFEYLNTDFFGFDSGTNSPANIEYPFLKESVSVNGSWQSPSVTGKAPINNVSTTITVYIKMTILAKAVSATSGVVNSIDVIKVKYEYYGTVAPLPAIVIATEERWFARGIGLIYNSNDFTGSKEIYNVGRYKIN